MVQCWLDASEQRGAEPLKISKGSFFVTGTVAARFFDASSTADDVLADVDLGAKRVLITGLSTGLGAETARALLTRGADVTGVARDLRKARRLSDHIANAGSLSLIECDLASLASVAACADRLVKKQEPFDVVIANAGIMAVPEKRLTVDGFELHFGTNHIGHFALINRIAGVIRDGGRAVMLASAAHRFADVDLDDPNFEYTSYSPPIAYGRSKTANVLFAMEFDRRHKDRGIRTAAVHPGNIRDTELGRHMSKDDLDAMIDGIEASLPPGQSLDWKTVPQGAATSVWAAFTAEADLVGGHYCEDCRVAETIPGDGLRGVQPYALDLDRAKALWARSEEMIGMKF